MNSNFEWQKHQANERVQAYREEAAAHRMVEDGKGRQSGAFLLKLAMLAGIFFIVWWLAGCTSGVAVEPVTLDSQPTAWTMADRIYFQDKREALLIKEAAIGLDTGWTLAQRIHFQDKREASLSWRACADRTLAQWIE